MRSAKLSHIDEYFDAGGHGCRMHHNAIQCATELLDRYSTNFTGIQFDPRRDGSETWWDPNRIGSNDLYAVAALSMPEFIEKRTLARIAKVFSVDHGASTSCTNFTCEIHLHCILRRVPENVSIFSPMASTNLTTLDVLWRAIEGRTVLESTSLLVNENIFGRAGLSKLIARKRPDLAPILDSVACDRVGRANGGHKPASYWTYMMTEFQASPSLSTNVATARAASVVPKWVTNLRIIDIVIWMRDNYPCR